jgi:hypothetical protein
MTFGRGGSVRAFSAIVMVAGLVFLAACGGGTPAGVPITISLTATLTSLNPGQSTTITATVANDSSNKGVSWTASPSGFGALSQKTTTSVVYTAPASVPTATAVTITATSIASPTVTASGQLSVQTSAVGVSLSPAAPQTINQGQQIAVNATLTNDTSNKGVTWSLSPNIGSLVGATTAAVTYQAPASVTTNTLVTLTATSVASTNATAALEITVFPSGAGPNVAALTVDSGPAGNSGNLAFVSVTICVPTTTTCQTVDNIQVDTGSAGLRILQSAMPALSLPTLGDPSGNGNSIFNCVNFQDGSYLWGPVQAADVKIGGEVASAANGELIQTISTSSAGIPTACSNGGTIDENTPSTLAANGILGVGLEPTDCFVQGLVNLCDGSVQAAPPAYFSCASSGCSSTTAPITIPANAQVTNPVAVFTSDNNGVAIQFPAVPGPEFAAPTLSGSLIFGIETQSNNVIPNTATAFGLASDSFTTLYAGQNLISSVIDSGSSALFFPSSIAVCTDNAAFYCPAALTPQTATNEGTNNVPSIVDFSVDNADNLFSITPPDTAFETLAGPNGTVGTCTSQGTGSCQFDWGLPFFYGKVVFTAIDGATVNNVGSGPFWAY